MVRLAIPEGAEGIIFAPYGDGWRQTRKICTVELLSARRVQSFRPIREEEVGRLLHAVASAAAPRPRAVNLSELLAVYAAESSVRAIIGSRIKDRDTFLALLERGLKLFANMSLPDLYPSSRLAMLVSRMPGRMKQHRQEANAFMDAMVQEHGESRAADDGDKEDLLDVLLRIQREGDQQFPLTTDNIKTVIGVSTAVSRSTNESNLIPLPWCFDPLMSSILLLTKLTVYVPCRTCSPEAARQVRRRCSGTWRSS
jgi:cytochrome P450